MGPGELWTGDVVGHLLLRKPLALVDEVVLHHGKNGVARVCGAADGEGGNKEGNEFGDDPASLGLLIGHGNTSQSSSKAR